ncbi:MAG: hypothetical protein PHI19_04050 [Clostridia bacterium]|nr:hypothetical protein [Clostridia bacterium]
MDDIVWCVKFLWINIEITVALHHQSGSDTVRYAHLVNDPFPEIEKLFEEHSVA